MRDYLLSDHSDLASDETDAVNAVDRLPRLRNGANSPAVYDPRPLWQRLDEDEDRQLLRQRRLIRRLKLSVLAALGVAAMVLFVNHF